MVALQDNYSITEAVICVIIAGSVILLHKFFYGWNRIPEGL
jgi:hypothetical protein